MAGFVGSRVKVPFYVPRLPTGGGGGGVFQPRGGTPWKPSPIGEAVGGLGKIFGSYLQGKYTGRERQIEEELLPLEKDLLGARAEYYRQPRGKARTEADIVKEMDGYLRSLTVLQNSPLYEEGKFSAQEQLLIKLLQDRQSELLESQGVKVKETIIPGTPAKESGWPLGLFDTPAVPETSTFELVPKSLTPSVPPTSPVVRATGLGPSELPPPFVGPPAPKPFIGPPAPMIPPRRKIESKEVRKVKPGLDAIAAARFGQAKEPQKATQPKQAFDKYPEPKTEKEFNNTISRIPSKKMKILYFEAMIKKMKDEKLAARIYEIWVDKIYE